MAAIENLVEFAAYEEYAMIGELPEEPDDSDLEDYCGIFERYNLTRAAQENEDVLYCAMMAAWWITVSSDTMLTFMTQGDERVRPWHEALEGLSYPKSLFPPELIPPIEYHCRCYLVAEGFGDIAGSLPEGKNPPRVHPVFRESLCTGGRIFSREHPYFKHTLPPELQAVIQDIKHKFHIR